MFSWHTDFLNSLHKFPAFSLLIHRVHLSHFSGNVKNAYLGVSHTISDLDWWCSTSYHLRCDFRLCWEIPFVSIDNTPISSVWIGIPFEVFALLEAFIFYVHSPSGVIFGVIFIRKYFQRMYMKFTEIEGRTEKEVWKLGVEVLILPWFHRWMPSQAQGLQPIPYSRRKLRSLLS